MRSPTTPLSKGVRRLTSAQYWTATIASSTRGSTVDGQLTSSSAPGRCCGCDGHDAHRRLPDLVETIDESIVNVEDARLRGQAAVADGYVRARVDVRMPLDEALDLKTGSGVPGSIYGD